MRPAITESRLASLGASAIARAFDRYQAQFSAITGRARRRFERKNWQQAQRDSRERLDLYSRIVQKTKTDLAGLLGDRFSDPVIWPTIKAVYSALISERDDWELAETFFNSVTRQIFTTVGVDPAIEFVSTDFTKPPTKAHQAVYHRYDPVGSTAALVEAVLTDFRFDVLYEDIRRDSKLVALEIEAHLRSSGRPQDLDRVEMVKSVFYRGQGAYLVGRLQSGPSTSPLVLALRNGPKGVAVDAVLLDGDDVSVLFSFTRSYFHVDVTRPFDLVAFLHSIAPLKRTNELYTAIGHHKHGKTELYRDLLNHLDDTDDCFEYAAGTEGLVMIVFTMPGYGVVFKVMRDVFGEPKKATRRSVKDKYRLVFRHDRAGRLVDAQEFEHLQFDRDRFEPALLEELLREAPASVDQVGDNIVIKHAYIERRVDPLNLFIRNQPDELAARAVIDYGRAIKDLAVTNIFPGDMLLKNFGVTRHGRVVFYDYDELTEITSCRFRAMPVATDDADEMAAEAWFGLDEGDIFPEEFSKFLGMPRHLREVFERHHSDLFDPAFWQSTQQRLRAGELIEIFPYAAAARLQRS